MDWYADSNHSCPSVPDANCAQYLYVKSPYFLNNRELWTNYPNRELAGTMKAYLLAQWGFWLQQVLVINIEERRKDHWQMLTHHFVTISLIAACYAYHHTRIGHLILMLMDVVDLFLPVRIAPGRPLPL